MAGYRTNIERESPRAAERVAIERWEDEGGRALAREERLQAWSGELAVSDPGAESSSAAGSQARSSREHATRSS